MIDSYSHGDIDIMYISENIPGPAEQSSEFQELLKNFDSRLVHSCKCNNLCLPDSCECLKISGGTNYLLRIEPNKNLGVHVICKNCNGSSIIYPIFECSELCHCSDICGNRLVQNGPIKTLYVKPSENNLIGLGLFTNTFIPKGSFVCEYAGEVLTKTQALFRQHYNEKHKKMNYIFCLNEHVAGSTVQTYIDPSCFGNIGRYINHSCDPNCEIVPVRISSPIPKLAVFSLLDIEPNSQITFDYGSDESNYVSDATLRKKCLCNSSKCKGFMPYLHC